MTLTDMAKTADEVAKETMPFSGASLGNVSRYPYGLCIRLDQDDLEKLDLEPNCEVGDVVHLHALAKVTSVNQRDTEAGMKCNIELQITHLEVESEDEENTEADRGSSQKRASKRYGGDGKDDGGSDDESDDAPDDEDEE